MLLESTAAIDSAPLKLRDVPTPKPNGGDVLVRVQACGICRTDLHVIEGELARHRMPIIPGHQVVGVVEECGSSAHRFNKGDRVGIAWLRYTCGKCRYCEAGNENLCPNARFTGYDANGGFAKFAIVNEAFAYALPQALKAESIAPLLCAGIIGFRALRRANVIPNSRVGLYGFGSSAHIAIQVAKYWGCQVYVMTRDAKHQALARELGANWAGSASEPPPTNLDSAILFAPAGELVLPALEALDMGGTLALAGIYLSDIPKLSYERHLFHEKNLRSVTANTREDGEELLRLAGEIPLVAQVQTFPLDEANAALQALKQDRISGSGVLMID
jgi:propanol-preferring alcohol dehydrogenase